MWDVYCVFSQWLFEAFSVKKKRPMNLDLGTIRLPVTSYVSILHRISGVFMFFAVAVLIWLFDMSLSSEEGYLFVVEIFNNLLAQIIIFSALSALAYHISTGIRHLVMDFGFAEDFRAGRISALIALLVAFFLIVLIAAWIYV